MTPFKELAELADRIRDQKGESCKVEITHWAWNTSVSNSESTLSYNLYMESFGSTKQFKTVSELITAMQDILNPTTDEGVSV